jgi:hypothetical protein
LRAEFCGIVPGNQKRPESRQRPGLRRPSAALLVPVPECWASRKPRQSLIADRGDW